MATVKIKINDETLYSHGEHLKPGDKVRHFKFETLTEDDKNDNYCIYEIVGFGMHSETNEFSVIYKSVSTGMIWIRPAKIFTSEVDHEKYPNIKQKYRFEKI